MERNSLMLELPAHGISRFYAALAGISAVLIGATLLSDLHSPIVDNVIGKQLDLKLEGNAAVWFSSFVLLVGGVAAGAVSQARRTGPLPARVLWLAVALFFVGLSVDETAELHEAIGRKFTAIVGTVPLLTEGTVPAFGWLLALAPAILLFIGCVVAALRTLPDLPGRTRRFSFAGLACWIGALGAEFVQAQLMRWGVDRSIEGAIEEGFELVGALLFVVAFVELLRALQRPCLSAVDKAVKIVESARAGARPAAPDTSWRASRSSRTTRS